MKIYTAQQIKEIDSYTIYNEPIKSIDLMERAALSCVHWLTDNFDVNTQYFIFCGKGNNGGDGLAITRILVKNNFQAQAFIFNEENKSYDHKMNLSRLQTSYPKSITLINDVNQLHKLAFTPNTVIIDALLGTGIDREVTGIYKETIQFLNQQRLLPKVAVDVPSGLFADKLTVQSQTVFEAKFTLTFQYPKLAFLFSENYLTVGNFFVLDIQLNDELFNEQLANFYYLDKKEIAPLLLPKDKFTHKGNNGHVLVIAGNSNKTGAAILTSLAALKSGCGLVTLASSKNTIIAMQANLPEVMSIRLGHEDFISELPKLNTYSAIAIGPGIGFEKQTANVLKLLIQEAKVPLVIDADAITLLAENKTWLSFLPIHSILTPHVKELERLIGKCAHSFERLEKTKHFVQKYRCIVIIKGAHSTIVAPNMPIYFNSTGNSVLAKGGSGDVLTGLLVGLLAQGYSSFQAAKLAVYIHGNAADQLITYQNFNSTIPSQLCNYF